jgi:hypothetical protein
MSMGMTHDRARQLVRRTQLAGLLVAAFAAALWAVEFPGLGSGLPAKDEPILIEQGPTTINEDQDEKSTRSIDKGTALHIAQNLDIASRRLPKADQGAIITPPTPEPAHTGPEIRFLGVVEEPERLVALLSIDGKQRMLAEGRSAGSVRMVEVSREQVIVQLGRERRTIPLAERSGSSVAWIAPGTGGGPGSAASIIHEPGAAAMMNAAMGTPGRASAGDPRRGSIGRPEDRGGRLNAPRPRGAGARDPNSVTTQNGSMQSSDSAVPTADSEN